MGDMNVAHINGKMLGWARQHAGIEAAELATAQITRVKIEEWESGKSFPTEAQADVLATRLGIPAAMFYMAEPPTNFEIKIPDLRTVNGVPLKHPSRDFQIVLRDTFARQEWCRNEREQTAFESLDFVSRFDLKDAPDDVARDIQNVLGITPTLRAAAKDSDDFLGKLIAKAEEIGILVMRSAIAGHSTRRSLSVEEFRGFALVDPVSPVVFINDEDAEAAQIFTFAHEISHIWIGQSGVSDQDPTKRRNSSNVVELFCDKIAAAVLVPEQEFIATWVDTNNLQTNITQGVRRFRVSSLVILRRALDLNRITLATFLPAVREQYDSFRRWDKERKDKQKRAKKAGGNFWASFDLRNGARFNSTVVAAVKGHRATYTEASSLFGVSLAATGRYFKRVGEA